MLEEQNIEFPECMSFLLTEPSRYKVLYGGRGAGKTQNIARALIILARFRKLRVLCGREFQNSILESVHAVIQEQIYALGYENEFTITDKAIYHKITKSEFIFKGLRYNIEAIKSMAAIDICWVEEANKVSRSTWNKLGPTIRGRHEDDERGNLGPFGQGPEIWISFNPELDDDETYVRFVLDPPSEYDNKGKRYSIVKKVNWTDNKWFPDDLRAEMEELKAKNKNAWLEVWEGHTKQVLDGAIFAEEIRQALLDKRIGQVKHDPGKPVSTFWDLGRRDKTAIWFAQTIGVEFNIINYYEDSLKKMPFYIGILQELSASKGYNYGMHHLPHDGAHETLSNISPQNQLLKVYPKKVRIIQAPSKKFVGINAVRTIFPLCNFDELNTKDGLMCLRRYCYKVDDETGTFSKEPDHDTPWSHGADAMQTLALAFRSETASKPRTITTATRGASLRNYNNNNWMGS